MDADPPAYGVNIAGRMTAMFSSFNTSLSVPDMETIAFALGAFIYAHPDLRHMSKKGHFELPFGDDTAYSLLKPHGFSFS